MNETVKKAEKKLKKMLDVAQMPGARVTSTTITKNQSDLKLYTTAVAPGTFWTAILVIVVLAAKKKGFRCWVYEYEYQIDKKYHMVQIVYQVLI